MPYWLPELRDALPAPSPCPSRTRIARELSHCAGPSCGRGGSVPPARRPLRRPHSAAAPPTLFESSPVPLGDIPPTHSRARTHRPARISPTSSRIYLDPLHPTHRG